MIFGVIVLRLGSGMGEKSENNSAVSGGSVHRDMHLQPEVTLWPFSRVCRVPGYEHPFVTLQVECQFLPFPSPVAITKS